MDQQNCSVKILSVYFVWVKNWANILEMRVIMGVDGRQCNGAAFKMQPSSITFSKSVVIVNFTRMMLRCQGKASFTKTSEFQITTSVVKIWYVCCYCQFHNDDVETSFTLTSKSVTPSVAKILYVHHQINTIFQNNSVPHITPGPGLEEILSSKCFHCMQFCYAWRKYAHHISVPISEILLLHIIK